MKSNNLTENQESNNIEPIGHSPFLIEVILHYYHSPEPFRNVNSKEFESVLPYLLQTGILIKKEVNRFGQIYTTNSEMAEVYVDALRKTPIPVKKYVIEYDD